MPTVRVTLTIEEDVYRKLKQRAKLEGRSVSNLANFLLKARTISIAKQKGEST